MTKFPLVYNHHELMPEEYKKFPVLDYDHFLQIPKHERYAILLRPGMLEWATASETHVALSHITVNPHTFQPTYALMVFFTAEDLAFCKLAFPEGG